MADLSTVNPVITALVSEIGRFRAKRDAYTKTEIGRNIYGNGIEHEHCSISLQASRTLDSQYEGKENARRGLSPKPHYS